MNIWSKYAKVLVEYSTNIQKGQLVTIRSTDLAQPLVKAIYEEVVKKGAYPYLRISLDGILSSFYKYADDEQLNFVDPFSKYEYENMDVNIVIGAPHNIKNLVNTPPEKMARFTKTNKVLMDLYLGRAAKKELSWVYCNYPTNALAQEAKMSLDEYTDFLLDSCYLNEEDPVKEWKRIKQEQDEFVKKLDGTKKIHVIGDETDITLSVDGRKWINCCGEINFPDGEIFTSPVEEGTNGIVYFDYPAIYRGSEAEKIRLEFKDGKVINASAEKGEAFFLSMINQDEGARRLGEFAIGTNTKIQKITGNILFDEKIGGSIHMALGASYPETGGKNESGLHWDLIKNMKNGGQIFADNRLVYENGKFVF